MRPRLLVGAALVAFAGNSLLCRAALGTHRMDPASFTFVRLTAGAGVLLLLTRGRGLGSTMRGGRALARPGALFAYAALFSFAYVRIPASIGALVLFAVVQLTMLGWAVRAGAGPRGAQWAGVLLAIAGLGALTLPGAASPDVVGTLLMAGAGLAWGAYSLLGAGAASPLASTTTAFVASVPAAAVLAGIAATGGSVHADALGIGLAVVSGSLASALGYVLWYAALPHLGATRAAVLQLAVPVLAAFGGIALLGEGISARLLGAGAAILGGIALVLRSPRR